MNYSGTMAPCFQAGESRGLSRGACRAVKAPLSADRRRNLRVAMENAGAIHIHVGDTTVVA